MKRTTSIGSMALAAMALGASASAATIYWNGTGTDWTTTLDWSTASGATTPNPAAVPGATDTAAFNISTVSAAQTVNLNGNQSVAKLDFLAGATGGVTLLGGGTDRTLTLGANGIGIAAATGAVTIGSSTSGQNVALSLTGAQTWTNNSGNLLTVNNGVSIAATGTLTLAGSGQGGTLINGDMANGAGTLAFTVNNASGTGMNTLTGSNSYTGATTVTKGLLTISGARGSILGTSGVTITSGTMTIDDRGVASSNTNRIKDTAALSLSAGSLFQYVGSDQAGTNSTETIGSINSPVGGGLTRISVAYSGTNAATLTAASIVRSSGGGGVILVNGTNLGANGGSSNVSRLNLTASSGMFMVGTSSAVASGINAGVYNTMISPYLLGEAAVGTGGLGTMTGTANTFITFNATTGMRPLNPTDEFSNNAIASNTANTYITLTTTAASSAAINSLVLNGGDLVVADGATLTNASGALLFVTSQAIRPASTAATYSVGTKEVVVSMGSGVTATINTAITGSNLSAYSVGSTPGTLILGGSSTYVGTTYMGAGSSLVIANNNALGNSTFRLNGGIVKTDGQARTIPNTFSVVGGSVIGGAGDLTLAGGTGPAVVFNANNNCQLTVANAGTTTISGTFSLNNAASGVYNNNGEGVTMGSSGNLVITGPITDNNSGNVVSGTGSLMTINFRGVGGNVTINPAVNNGYGANYSSQALTSNGGYNTVTLGGPGGAGAVITPLGLGPIYSNDANGRTVFLQALNNDQILSNTISIGGSAVGQAPFGFTGSNNLTLSGPLTAAVTFPNLATGTLTFSGTLSIGTGVLSIVGPGNTVISGSAAFVGTTGGFTKTGPGVLTLATSNTAVGATTLNGGTVVLDYSAANASRLSSGTSATAALTLGGADLQLKGGSYAQTLGTGGNSTLGSGQSKITQTGGGSSTIALGSVTRSAGGTLDVGTGVASVTNANSSGIVGGWVTVNGADWATGAGTLAALASYDSFAVPGTNKNILQSGAAALASSTTVNSLKINTTGAAQSLDIGAGRALTLSSGGLLFVGADDYAVTTGTLKSATATNSDLIIQQYGAGTLTIGSAITNGTGTSTLTKGGTGKLILSGSNSYTGATYFNGGVTQIDNSTNLGTGTLAFNGGTLEITNGFSTSRAVVLNPNGGTIQVDAGIQTLSGAVSTGNAYTTLTKTGAGTLLLSASNSYVGATFIKEGTLQLGNAYGLGSPATTANRGTSPVTVNGGTLDINGFNAAIGNFILANGSVTDSAGTGSLAAYSYALQSGSVGAALADLVTPTAAGANPSTSINLYKTTTGTVTLTGVNTYTGLTTITEGTLVVGASGSVNSSAGIKINGGELKYNSATALTKAIVFGENGGKISGTGTVNTALTIGSGMTLSPGNSPGTQSFSSLAWTKGGSYVWEINQKTGTEGADPGWDVINVGTLDITALSATDQFNIDITGLTGVGSAAAGTWTILNYTTLTGTFDTSLFNLTQSGFDGSWSGGTWSISNSGSSLQLTYVPEPAMLSILGLGALAFLRRRKNG